MDRAQKPRLMDTPEPCFIRMKLIAKGPWIGARIFMRLGMLAGEINGVPADPIQIWHAGEFITEEQYAVMMEPPLLNPFIPVYVSDKGLSDAVKEAEEADYWWRP